MTNQMKAAERYFRAGSRSRRWISYKFLPWEAGIGSKYRELEKSRVRKIGGKFTMFNRSKSKGNVPWFEKSGFHCIVTNEKCMSN